MEIQHQLKHHGNYSLFEQAQMTAEDRQWTIQRLQKQFKDDNDKAGGDRPRGIPG